MRPEFAALGARVRTAASHVRLFPLVHQLERLLSPASPVGGDESASGERVHFTHRPDFDFPTADVVGLEFGPGDGTNDVTLATTPLGLIGSQSPLVPAVSEDVRFDSDTGNLQAFFDVFHHRAMSLLYRTWKRYSKTASFADTSWGSYERALLSMVGIDPFGPGYEEAAKEGRFVLGLSDFVNCDPAFIDLSAFEAILRRAFPDLGVRLSKGEPKFVPFADGEQTRLGVLRSVLGVDAVYGDGALDEGGAVRVTVGPVAPADNDELFPGGRIYRDLQRLTDQWAHGRFELELEVIVKGDSAPSLSFGGGPGSALGIDSCVGTDSATTIAMRVPLVREGQPADRSYHVQS